MNLIFKYYVREFEASERYGSISILSSILIVA